MSFTGQVKQEIGRQTAAAKHCRIAELAALLSFAGTVLITEDEQISISFRTEQEVVCSTFLRLLKKTFRFPEEQILCEEALRAKTSIYHVLIEDPDAAAQVLRAMDVMDAEGNFRDDLPLTEQPCLKKSCCRKAYLKGAFLAAGTVSNPNRSYHLEFLCEDRNMAGQIRDLLDSLGIAASVSARGRYFPVYIKEGSAISDLLSMMDAKVSMMDFENARIVREVRGNINRQVNCETANIRKTADAAAEQIEDIRYIEKTAGLGSLSRTLDETARIRLQYPSATLQELGEMLDPPVGKSGINHRLRKISSIAAQLRSEQGGD